MEALSAARVRHPGEPCLIYFPAIQQQESIPVIVQETEMPRGDETILLVDDESYIRDIGQQVLTEFGYTVLHAVDGESALQIYEKDRERIDLIILDIIMPGMGKLQCLKDLTASPSCAKIIGCKRLCRCSIERMSTPGC